MATVSQKTRVKPHLGLGSAGKLMSVKEFDEFPNHRCDKRFRYELINGVLVVTPVADNGELDPNDELAYLLRGHQEFHPQGSALDLTLPEQTITTTNRRRVDRAIWIGLGRLPEMEVDFPTIIIEIVSKRKRDQDRDYLVKRDEYLAAGAKEYWIIDRFSRTMTVYRPTLEGGFTTQVVQEIEIYQIPLLPGFELPLARLLSRADRWTRRRVPKPPPA